MSGISFDADQVGAYRELLVHGADRLAATGSLLADGAPKDDGFGTLGEASHAVDSYARATESLRNRLAAASASFSSAADGLATVAAGYAESDEDSVAEIRRGDHGRA